MQTHFDDCSLHRQILSFACSKGKKSSCSRFFVCSFVLSRVAVYLNLTTEHANICCSMQTPMQPFLTVWYVLMLVFRSYFSIFQKQQTNTYCHFPQHIIFHRFVRFLSIHIKCGVKCLFKWKIRFRNVFVWWISA